MADDWRDKTPGRVGVSIGQLSDGEGVTAMIMGDPSWQDHEIEQDDGTVDETEALHLPVGFLEIPAEFVDMSGEEVRTAEDSDGEMEVYDIINSSTSFYESLKSEFPEGQVDGQTIEITAGELEPGVPTSRYYTVETA